MIQELVEAFGSRYPTSYIETHIINPAPNADFLFIDLI